MNGRLTFAVVTGMFACSSLTMAQPMPPDTIVLSGAAGIEAHQQAYREPSLNVSEDGELGGLILDGRLSYNEWQLRGEILFAAGKIDYSNSGSIGGITDVEVDGRIIAAYAYELDSVNELTLYFGYGYRRLADYIGGMTSSTGELGYDRISQYHYLPMGIETLFELTYGWSFKTTFEYDYFIRGYQYSNLSTAIAGYNDLHNNQHSGYGLRGSILAHTDIWGTPVEFGPFVRYWNIGQSDSQAILLNGAPTGLVGIEPANHTVELGLRFKVWL